MICTQGDHFCNIGYFHEIYKEKAEFTHIVLIPELVQLETKARYKLFFRWIQTQRVQTDIKNKKL